VRRLICWTGRCGKIPGQARASLADLHFTHRSAREKPPQHWLPRPLPRTAARAMLAAELPAGDGHCLAGVHKDSPRRSGANTRRLSEPRVFFQVHSSAAEFGLR